jgi:predicted exporter
VFSVAGLVAAALTTRWVLPLAVPNGTPGVGLRRRLARGAQVLMHTLPRARRVCIALGFASAALLLWRHEQLWQTELSSLSPVPAPELALDAALRADLQAGDERTLVAVTGDNVDTVLQRVEAVSLRLDALVQRGELSGYDAITRWLPSLATQAQRRAALPDADALRTRLAAATAGGPLPAQRLQPFIDEVQRARSAAPITADTLAQSPLAPLAAALLVRGRDGRITAWLPLRASGAGPKAARLQQALSGIAGAQVLVLGDELRSLYRRYLGEAQAQALLGALGVVLLMAAWLRSLPRLLAGCPPLLLAVLITMAGFTLAGVPLGILHLVGLLLVVAVGSNYALFIDGLRQQPSSNLLRQQPYPTPLREQPCADPPRPPSAHAADTLASLLLANLTIVLSFGLLALSQVPALSAIGRVVAPGALLALLLSIACAGAPLPRARGSTGNL